jgi:hypothetical protein
MLWLKSKNESIRVTNPLFVPEEKDFKSYGNINKDLQSYAPKFIELKELKIKIVTTCY